MFASEARGACSRAEDPWTLALAFDIQQAPRSNLPYLHSDQSLFLNMTVTEAVQETVQGVTDTTQHAVREAKALLPGPEKNTSCKFQKAWDS